MVAAASMTPVGTAQIYIAGLGCVAARSYDDRYPFFHHPTNLWVDDMFSLETDFRAWPSGFMQDDWTSQIIQAGSWKNLEILLVNLPVQGAETIRAHECMRDIVGSDGQSAACKVGSRAGETCTYVQVSPRLTAAIAGG